MRTREDYAVIYNGKVAYYLNAKLAEKQNITDAELFALKRLHHRKLAIFELAEMTVLPNELRHIAQDLEKIEFEMQKNWHLPQDRNFHEWYLLPKCTCPKMDNQERRGTEYRITNEDCPCHGS